MGYCKPHQYALQKAARDRMRAADWLARKLTEEAEAKERAKAELEFLRNRPPLGPATDDDREDRPYQEPWEDPDPFGLHMDFGPVDSEQPGAESDRDPNSIE